MGVHASNSSTRWIEAGGSKIQGLLGLLKARLKNKTRLSSATGKQRLRAHTFQFTPGVLIVIVTVAFSTDHKQY